LKPKQAHTSVKLVLTSRNINILKTCTSTYRKAPILVAINHRNQSQKIVQALASVEAQSAFSEQQVQVVILDDHSDEASVKRLLILADKPYVTLIRAQCGSAAQARNAILDWADEQMFVRWVARLDADDEFATIDSLRECIELGELLGKSVVLAGNQLNINGCLEPSVNYPLQEWVEDPEKLVTFIDRFCHGQEQHELPSCNLVLANRAGIRYPSLKSAEDHWLVAMLLLLQPNQVALAIKTIYCNYSLNGNTTRKNKTNNVWFETRHKLAFVAKKIYETQSLGATLLGFGMEGVVYESGSIIIKEFYPWGLMLEDVKRLAPFIQNPALPIVQGSFKQQGLAWFFCSENIRYKSVAKTISYQKIKQFLVACYIGGIAPTNIKRDNLMYHPNGDLHYIDIGKDLKTLSTGYFIDLSARLYAIGVLGFSDHELARRPTSIPQEDSLASLDGFKEFYSELITQLHPLFEEYPPSLSTQEQHNDTTLLIKSCAQDADGFYEQICHIVTQLEYPKRFAKKLLLIDLFNGPFLRQYARPNLTSVLEQAKRLEAEGVIDQVISAPSTTEEILKTYNNWFNTIDVKETHTTSNAPLYNQIWAFEQIETRYVLQCDCDVLIGRQDWLHDFVADMHCELQKPEVHSVGFNIPKSTGTFLPYFGEPGQFAPEVRFGMLDLHKYKRALPIINPVVEGRFQLTWHRAMQQHEKQSSYLRSVRGGNPKTFYVHPSNIDKSFLRSGVIRDLISQGKVPLQQQEAFDLVTHVKWQYECRSEEVVFLVKGKNTSYPKLARCIESLSAQKDQGFGVIVIDDGSSLVHSWCYPKLMSKLSDKMTLIRHAKHHGRMPNFLQAIYDVCDNPNTLIAVLDQDDFLMSSEVVHTLKQARRKGHDVVQLPMFRPNKPLKLYQPDYVNSRQKHGANVWAHLRAFTKECFMKIPVHAFKQPNGQWFDCVTDYATMLPLCEVAKNPGFIDTGYAYWHERDAYPSDYKQHQNKLLADLFTREKVSMRNGAPVPELSEFE